MTPDIPKPDNGTHGRTEGWSFNLHRLISSSGSGGVGWAVYPSWSKGNTHGSGHGSARSETQQGIAQYSTKALALQGLRAAFGEWVLQRLAVVDAAIDDEVLR